MKKLLTLVLSLFLCISSVSAMEKAPEDSMSVTLKLESVPYTISLQKVLAHICNYQILTDPLTKEICVKGFHWYGTTAEKIDLGNGATLCKLTPGLWIVALGDIYSFHTGYVIYRGKVCKAPKTFFPCNWNIHDIAHYIKGMHQESELQVKERKERTSESYKVYRVKMIPLPVSRLITPLRLFVLGCPGVKESMHILTVYPEIQHKDYPLANLESFAVQQAKGLNTVKKVERKPELIQAVEEGYVSKVIELLEKGADPTIANERGITPLMMCAKAGDWCLVNTLLEYGASKTACDDKRNTVLHYAVQSGDFYCVLGLISPETLNAQNNEGITPLMLAVINKHVDIVSLLLQWHVELNAKDAFGRTALMHAVTQVDPKGTLFYKAIVELLIKYGAEIDAQDKAGDSALIHAAFHNKIPLVELLLNAHAGYTLKNNRGESTLSLAKKNADQTLLKCIERVIERKNTWMKDYAASEFLYAAYSNNTAQVKQLVVSHEIDEQDNVGRTALFFAADNNNLELVQVLLQKGANPCFQTQYAQSIDHYVHQNSKILPSVREVIEQAAQEYRALLKEKRTKENNERQRKFVLLHDYIMKNDVSKVPLEIISQFNNQAMSKDGCTPLLYAVRERKYNAVSQLLALGASTQAEDSNNRDALCIALDNEDSEMVSLLIASGKVRGSSIEHNFTAVLTHKKYARARLLAQKALYTVYSFIRKAITKHEVSTVELIFQEHIIELTPEQAGQLLFEAIQSLDESIVKIMLKYCAFGIDYAYERGETPLMRAVKLERYSIVELLSNAGANIHLKDKDGASALDHAKYNAHLCNLLETPEKRKKEEALRVQHLQTKELVQKKLEEEGCTPLMIAVHFGEKEAVQRSNDDVNACDKSKQTALMIAACQGASDMVRMLLAKQGVKVNQADVISNTALMYAVKYKHYEIAQALIAAGAVVCFVNKAGESIMQLLEMQEVPPFVKESAKRKLRQELSIYLSLGAKMSVPAEIATYFDRFKFHLRKLHDDDKIYLINQVVGLGRADMLKMLLNVMPYPQKKQEKALLDPLEYAVQCNDSAIVITLLNYYTCIPAKIVLSALEAGKLALAQLLLNTGTVEMGGNEESVSIFSALCEHDKEGVVLPRFITGYIKDVNHNYSGVHLLGVACRVGNKKAGKLLLQAGASIDQADSEGWTALQDAANKGNLEIVSLLLKRGANVNAQDEEKCTALMHAAEEGYADVVAALIKAGAHVNTSDVKGLTALYSAIVNNHSAIVYQLVQAGVPVDGKIADGHTALLIAAEQGNLEAVKLLLHLGANPNQTCDHAHTALLLAALSGHKEIVKVLFEAGASLDAHYKEGISELHIFDEKYLQSRRIFRELLLSEAIKVDVTKKDVINFFCLACAVGEAEIVHYLIKKGIDVNAQGSPGMIPLRCACDRGHAQIVQLLLAAGARTNILDEAGLTPLAKACSIGRADIVKLLLEASADVNAQVRLKTYSSQMPAYIFMNPTSQAVCVILEADTPLIIACYNNHKEIVQLLLSTRRVNLSLKNKEGSTVFDIVRPGKYNGGMALTFNTGTGNMTYAQRYKKHQLRDMDARALEIKKLVLEYAKQTSAEQPPH